MSSSDKPTQKAVYGRLRFNAPPPEPRTRRQRELFWNRWRRVMKMRAEQRQQGER